MAGRIPQDFIDELLARVDIVELVQQRISLKKAGKDYSACCPFHDERTPSFTVSPDKQFYHCFGCGAHGTAISFLMEYDRLEFREAVGELAQLAGMELPEQAVTGEGPDTRPLYDALAKAEKYYREQLRQAPAAIEYLKHRGLSGKTAARFGIGFAPTGWDNLRQQFEPGQAQDELLLRAGLLKRREGHQDGGYDVFRERIMFPIHDSRGRTIAFGGRAMGDNGPKYLNSPETEVFHKGRELYGLFEARQEQRKPERLLVVEGYMDVAMLAEHGINNAVATLGTATTTDHAERLFRVVSEVVFCFDGDRAGREAAWRALENTLPVMRDGRQARFLFLPEGHDPDTLVQEEGAEAFSRRLDSASALSDFLFRHLGEKLDPASAEGRAALVERARPLIARVPPGAFRILLTEQLAELSRMDSTQLGRMVDQPTRGKARQSPPRRGPQRLKLTPMRKAIALLLQHPQLAQSLDDTDRERLAGVDIRGIDLLRECLELLQRKPDLGTASLLEHWRDTPHYQPMARLVQSDPGVNAGEVDESRLQQEFRDTLVRLCREGGAASRRLQQLLAKSGHTREETEEINELLRQVRE